ncbi:MAG: hypothetical protein K2J77_09300 [Oscillospiraceae bacterium]|nr:hypothetical protein [Oscillospiraceae bacterium]
MTLKKAGNILFLIAGIAIVVFIFCVIFIKSDADTWRAFAVCMPITGICFWGGVILRIVDHIRKK